jgi:pimeloyl-ACP methyl ester carboxylesterase
LKEGFLEERNIYYRTNALDPARRTLFFVHGLSGSSSAWKNYEDHFGKNYNVVSLDLRGHGKSLRPKDYRDYAIPESAEDIYQLAAHLGLSKFCIIGHSFGTFAELEFLSQHQIDVAAAVFLSPDFNIRRRRIVNFVLPFLNALIFIADLLPYIKKYGGHVDYSHYRNTGDWNLRRSRADALNTGPRSYLYSTRQSYDFNGEHILDRINGPVLIVHGKKDTIFPVKNALIMAERMRGAKLVLLNDADHILVLNNFREVSEAIDNFLGTLSAL